MNGASNNTYTFKTPGLGAKNGRDQGCHREKQKVDIDVLIQID